MSVPISDPSTCATMSLTPGIVVSSCARSWIGSKAFPTAASTSSIPFASGRSPSAHACRAIRQVSLFAHPAQLPSIRRSYDSVSTKRIPRRLRPTTTPSGCVARHLVPDLTTWARRGWSYVQRIQGVAVGAEKVCLSHDRRSVAGTGNGNWRIW